MQGCTRSFPPSPWSGQGCPSCLLGARSFLEPWAAQLELSPFPFLTQSFCQDVLLPAPQGSSLAPRPLSGVGVSPCPGPVPSVFWSKDHNLVCLQALSQVVFLLQRSGPGSIRGLQWARKGKEKYPPDAEITGGRPTLPGEQGPQSVCGFPAWAPMSSVQRPAPRFTAQRRTHRSWARGCWLPATAINMEPARPSRV